METARQQVLLHHPQGLHARPATLLVELARQFTSEISVRLSGGKANAKSILSVLALGAESGSQVWIEATGEDAPQAVAALVALVASDFGDKSGAQAERTS
jgi:phosphotransferase system HPr (HPr) family protein